MRFISHTCSHCGKSDRIDRAILVQCPACLADPGHPCIDLRPATYKPIASMHPERREAVSRTDESNRAKVAAAKLAAV